MQQLDEGDLFSLTLWRNESGYCAGVQRRAGDLVKYETRSKPSEAIAAALAKLAPLIAPPPF